MYLQITTKCNMTCDHCCYSCTKYGRHGDYNTIIEAIRFASSYYGDENISIGGGEPTLHPKFFEILKEAINNFDYVWMATNGSQTESMYRLMNIIEGEDFPECDCQERYTKEELLEYTEYEDGCLCHEKYDDDSIHLKRPDQLAVALSVDYFHDPINPNIKRMWENKSKIGNYNYELRDVSNHVIAEGRAIKTGSGWEEGCVCTDIIIKPTGKLRLCGCINSPIIGDIHRGIDKKWEDVMHSDHFENERCYKSIRG